MLPKEKESGDESSQEEDNHEPAHQDEETAPDEDKLTEEECDAAIAGLLAEIEQLRAEISELREHHAAHERDNEHTPRRVEPGPADGDVSPDERHWYFKRIGR